MLTPAEWHTRYQQQAIWTKDLRQHLYSRSGLRDAKVVLDVGCGTGALLPELREDSSALVCGLDIDSSNLQIAALQTLDTHLQQGDAHHLPFTSGAFDLSVCHFLLLWVADPEGVTAEMVRVTRRGGAVLVLAEPDYGGRIDHPPEFEVIAEWQVNSLSAQGADPRMGRQLAGLLHETGLKNIESGVLGAHWQGSPSRKDLDLEWDVLLHDLKEHSAADNAPEGLKKRISQLREQEVTAWKNGERILFVPTFFAWGRVP